MPAKKRPAVRMSDDELREKLYFDPLTNRICWKVAHPPYPVGQPVYALQKKNGYRIVRLKRVNFMEHRLIWFFVHGAWPKNGLDHKNGIKDDNRPDNLRDVTKTVNNQNKRKARADKILNTPLGVTYLWFLKKPKTKKFRASVSINGKDKFLGKFHTPEEAHQCYLEAKRRLHEGCLI
jgi:hypothetical protein